MSNVVSMNSLNTHDANDMKSHKVGDAMFDEDDLFSSPTLNDQNYYVKACPLSMMIIVMILTI